MTLQAPLTATVQSPAAAAGTVATSSAGQPIAVSRDVLMREAVNTDPIIHNLANVVSKLMAQGIRPENAPLMAEAQTRLLAELDRYALTRGVVLASSAAVNAATPVASTPSAIANGTSSAATSAGAAAGVPGKTSVALNDAQMAVFKAQANAIRHQAADTPLPPQYHGPLLMPRDVLAGKIRERMASGSISLRHHRQIIPSIMPLGIDPNVLVTEYDRRILAVIKHEAARLDALPANISDTTPTSGDGSTDQMDSSAKLRALIERKKLGLYERQRQLREEVVAGLATSTILATTQDRNAFRRVKKLTQRDSRAAERMETRNREQRELREKESRAGAVNMLATHINSFTTWHNQAQSRMSTLGKQVLIAHQNAEKEEARRRERIAKERLRALQENDEAAYNRLLGEAKDSRIAAMLAQTSEYFTRMKRALLAQQGDVAGLALQHYDDDAGDDAEDSVRQAKEYLDIAHRIKEPISVQPSILVGGTLKEYQLRGLEWMVSLYNNRLNGLLADEMGLGKTVQTIALITYLIEMKQQNGPFLVVVPLSTLPNWSNEFQKWAPSVRTVVYRGNPTQRRSIFSHDMRPGTYHCVLTTYEHVIQDKAVLGRIRWVHIIIDEGHRLKNSEAKLTTTLSQYTTRHRLILTGTPLQNNLPELWSLLNFILPKMFNSVKNFDEWFSAPFAAQSGNAVDKVVLTEEEQLLIIKRLHRVLEPFLLRRLKKQVETELPDKIERVIKCKMSALQSYLYRSMKKFNIMFQREAGDESKKSAQMKVKGVTNAIMELRKICNHPYVYQHVELEVNPSMYTNETMVRCAGKLELLDRMLPKLICTGHQVLIFFQMVKVIDIVGDYLDSKGVKFLRLDGMSKAEDRSDMIKKFSVPDSEYRVFLLSTRAGGLGLNLQTSDTVIYYDSDWNPHADLQAQDRAHRIGQKNEVRIFRLMMEKSVEVNILEIAKYKLDIDGKIIQAGMFDQKSSDKDREAFLRELLNDTEGTGDQEDEEEEMTDEELNRLVARSDEEFELFTRMDRERDEEAERRWREAGNTGPVPARLMSEDEVPELYKQDYDPEVEEKKKLAEASGRRPRGQVMYDDGLSEEQWTRAVDAGIDVDEVARRQRNRRFQRMMEGTDSGTMTPMGDSEADATPGLGDDDADDLAATPRKRKFDATISGTATPANGDGDHGAAARPSTAKRKKLTASALDATTMRERDHINTQIGRIISTLEATTITIDGEVHEPISAFRTMVSKSQYPEYYQVIRHPIAMSIIKRKYKNGGYAALEQFRDDVYLMVKNAHEFNEEGSWVVRDADHLKSVFDQQYDALVGDD